jgi:sterol desaturase/sphingolipid hydroxylase (fatty acid hydroxylase superfamily)
MTKTPSPLYAAHAPVTPLQNSGQQQAQVVQSIWHRSHYFDKMSLAELVRAYFAHYTVIVYMLLCVASGALLYRFPVSWHMALGSFFIVWLLWHAIWYGIHRWIMHGQWMYKSKFLAQTWKRIHYDHHVDPNHMEVLFGALSHTLPTLAIFTFPLGYALSGVGGAAVMFLAALIFTLYNEFIHCIQHLKFQPKWKWVARVKRHHLLHHFHNESGNYGISNNIWDYALQSFYGKPGLKPKSPTVFNLGYNDEKALLWPEVRSLSGGLTDVQAQRQRNSH